MKMLTVTLPSGAVWGVPIEVIARNRAEHYAPEFDGDVERSLAEDTLPLFEAEPYEVQDWASNQLNWSDVAAHARELRPPPMPDFQEAWVSGTMSVEEVEG